MTKCFYYKKPFFEIVKGDGGSVVCIDLNLNLIT
jgi:hypothetical protein